MNVPKLEWARVQQSSTKPSLCLMNYTINIFPARGRRMHISEWLSEVLVWRRMWWSWDEFMLWDGISSSRQEIVRMTQTVRNWNWNELWFISAQKLILKKWWIMVIEVESHKLRIFILVLFFADKWLNYLFVNDVKA